MLESCAFAFKKLNLQWMTNDKFMARQYLPKRIDYSTSIGEVLKPLYFFADRVAGAAILLNQLGSAQIVHA